MVSVSTLGGHGCAQLREPWLSLRELTPPMCKVVHRLELRRLRWIRDVGIPAGMQRAMAKQAEAERERRAKVIRAEAEAQAATRLAGPPT